MSNKLLEKMMSHSNKKESTIDSDLDFFKQSPKKQINKAEWDYFLPENFPKNISYLMRGVAFTISFTIFMLIINSNFFGKVENIPYRVDTPAPFPMEVRPIEENFVKKTIITPNVDQSDILTKNNINTSKMTTEQIDSLTKLANGLESITTELSKVK